MCRSGRYINWQVLCQTHQPYIRRRHRCSGRERGAKLRCIPSSYSLARTAGTRWAFDSSVLETAWSFDYDMTLDIGVFLWFPASFAPSFFGQTIPGMLAEIPPSRELIRKFQFTNFVSGEFCKTSSVRRRRQGMVQSSWTKTFHGGCRTKRAQTLMQIGRN